MNFIVKSWKVGESVGEKTEYSILSWNHRYNQNFRLEKVFVPKFLAILFFLR